MKLQIDSIFRHIIQRNVVFKPTYTDVYTNFNNRILTEEEVYSYKLTVSLPSGYQQHLQQPETK